MVATETLSLIVRCLANLRHLLNQHNPPRPNRQHYAQVGLAL